MCSLQSRNGTEQIWNKNKTEWICFYRFNLKFFPEIRQFIFTIEAFWKHFFEILSNLPCVSGIYEKQRANLKYSIPSTCTNIHKHRPWSVSRVESSRPAIDESTTSSYATLFLFLCKNHVYLYVCLSFHRHVYFLDGFFPKLVVLKLYLGGYNIECEVSVLFPRETLSVWGICFRAFLEICKWKNPSCSQHVRPSVRSHDCSS